MVSYCRLQCGRAARGAASLFIGLAVCACSENGGNAGDDSASSLSAEQEEFHADNDIAMTVRSIVDAIRVGENLDTADYNFNGVLTDGIGRPLYSTLQGHPGMWDVDVLSSSMAVIRNQEIGDLLPEDLESYIISNLNLTDADLIDSLEYHGAMGAETSVYDFGGGFLRLDTRTESSASGLEGALVRITASRDLPSPRK
ncbi:MAG: hypothetical protein K2G67_01930 [Muribaculaceae bacterium]|nr:hypothetical protein [Muribaculaceae bacterium]